MYSVLTLMYLAQGKKYNPTVLDLTLACPRKKRKGIIIIIVFPVNVWIQLDIAYARVGDKLSPTLTT